LTLLSRPQKRTYPSSGNYTLTTGAISKPLVVLTARKPI